MHGRYLKTWLGIGSYYTENKRSKKKWLNEFGPYFTNLSRKSRKAIGKVGYKNQRLKGGGYPQHSITDTDRIPRGRSHGSQTANL